MKKILCATGENSITLTVSRFENYEVVGEADFKSEIVDLCMELQPEILLLSENVSGKEPLPEIIIELSKKMPQIRVVFLTGNIDFLENDRKSFFEAIVYAGVYDIVHEDQITSRIILSALDNPKKKEDVSYLIKKDKFRRNKNTFIFKDEDEESEDVDDFYKNLYAISSIKPGTGKSFVSTNVATMIAEYGEKKDGKKPKVALIEADLQNLSLGTLLGIEDGKHNLKTVMDQIQGIINKNGKLIDDREKIETVNQHIYESFKSYEHCKNLYSLVGSQVTLQELENVNPMHYIYLVESIIKDFDVIIIDTNSALTHVTTFPLLSMSNTCYYVLNLDYNNVRNNYRYKGFLEKIGISERVKYILNENVPSDASLFSGFDKEDLAYNDKMVELDFALEAKIPIVPKTIFLNRIYHGQTLSLDNKDYTLEARYEIMKVADQIWPISIKEKTEKQLIESKKKKKKLPFFK